MTGIDRLEKCVDAVDLPVAIPPVNPSIFMESKGRLRGCVCANRIQYIIMGAELCVVGELNFRGGRMVQKRNE